MRKSAIETWSEVSVLVWGVRDGFFEEIMYDLGYEVWGMRKMNSGKGQRGAILDCIS